MKNVTLSADEALIKAARERARQEHTTLNEQFRRWLADYAQRDGRARQCDEVVARLRGRLQVGPMPDRAQRNAR